MKKYVKLNEHKHKEAFSLFDVCFQLLQNNKDNNKYQNWPELIEIQGCIPWYLGWGEEEEEEEPEEAEEDEEEDEEEEEEDCNMITFLNCYFDNECRHF